DRAERRVPVLAKEFVVDERQIEEALDRGADAVLLIARIVSPARLVQLARAALQMGIEPLVEIVDEPELASASEAGARILGVNARDLDTLQMDAARAARVLAAVPPGVVSVHLSGRRLEAVSGPPKLHPRIPNVLRSGVVLLSGWIDAYLDHLRVERALAGNTL